MPTVPDQGHEWSPLRLGILTRERQGSDLDTKSGVVFYTAFGVYYMFGA